MIKALRKLWCVTFHFWPDSPGYWPSRCKYCTKPVHTVELPPRLLFDWQRDYAPHWEPGSTAFWLEPDNPDDLAAWYGKYRPGEYGIKEAAGLRISLEPPRTQLSQLQQSTLYGLLHSPYHNAVNANALNGVFRKGIF